MIEFKIIHTKVEDGKTLVEGAYYVGAFANRPGTDINGNATVESYFNRNKLKDYTFIFDGELSKTEIENLMKTKLVGEAQSNGRTPIPGQTL